MVTKFPVTRDPKTGKQTHCKRGHEYTPENTKLSKNGYGGDPTRSCRACESDRVASRKFIQPDAVSLGHPVICKNCSYTRFVHETLETESWRCMRCGQEHY